MAVVSNLSDAQLDALTDAGATVQLVAPVAKPVVFTDTRMTFYMADPSAPPAQSGLRVQIATKDGTKDVRVADITGAAAGDAITGAERTALVRLLRKIWGNQVLP